MSMILALLLMVPAPVAQQDDPEAEYRAQYARWSEISGMTDPVAQADAYLEFLEEGLDQRLFQFVIGGIQQAIMDMTAAGNYDAVYPAADRLAELHPDSQLAATALALQAAEMAGSAEQITNYGETFYQTNPSPQLAMLLLQAFGQLNDEARTMEYGKIVVASGEYPIEQTWRIQFAMLREHDADDEDDEAVEIARKIREGLPAAPEGVSASDWDDIQIYLLELMARYNFEAERWTEALANYEEILTYQPRSDKALYFKGNLMLRTGAGVSSAAEVLAEAAVLDGPYSGRARELFESTWNSNADPETAARYINEGLAAARSKMASNN